MGHMISPPRKDLSYAVVDMDGTPLSWHRTSEAAERAVEAELRRFRRRYPADGSRGNATAYLPRTVLSCDAPTYIERAGPYSTGWHAV